jgi:hypothetical protein
MTRLVLRDSLLHKTIFVCLLIFAFLHAPVAFAQHSGVRMGGVPHLAPPPIVVHPPTIRPRPQFRPAPPVGAFNFRGVPFRLHQPIYPFFPFYGSPFFFGEPFWGFGAGWAYSSCLWSACDLFWLWGPSYTAPIYPYGLGAYAYTPPIYEYPSYVYGERERDLPQLYMKDGTVYTVTDYWLVDDQLHFVMMEPGPQGGMKTVEHVIDFDELDLQTTIDVATRRGFRFVLRNEPLEQYMKDHPNETPPPVTPPTPK